MNALRRGGFPEGVKVRGFGAGGEVGFELVEREVEECHDMSPVIARRPPNQSHEECS